MTNRLGQLDVPLAVLITLGERLVETQPSIRAAMQALYGRSAINDQEPALAQLVQATYVLETDRQTDLEAAKANLNAAYQERGVSPLVARALIQMLGKFLDLAHGEGPPSDPTTQARIAELYTDIHAPQAAIAAWQQTVSTPEFSRRFMSEIEAILDSLELPQVVHAYFATAGWKVTEGAGSTGSDINLAVTPGPVAIAELASRFEDTPSLLSLLRRVGR